MKVVAWPSKRKMLPCTFGLFEKHAGVVDQISGGEVVGAVEDDVVVGEDVQHVALVKPRLVLNHVDVRIQGIDGQPRRFDLRHPNALRRVDHLALQVRIVDDVGVDNPERADSRSGEVKRGGRTETAGANQEDLRIEELALPLFAHLRDQEMPAVAPALVRRQSLRDAPGQT